MTKTLTEQYSNVIFLKDDQIQKEAYMLATRKPDYSKMHFEFHFTDGEIAKYRMDKDCHNLQQFFDRVNNFHKLEKQLAIATKALKEYSDKEKWEYCSPDWRDAEKALKEMEGVK